MTQLSFEKELQQIYEELLKMGGMVEKAISSSIVALKDFNTRLAQEVIQYDKEIDIQELKIDDLCFTYLALRQPKATDLRFIISGMKIINELERMGDYAESIARQAIFLSSKKRWIRPLVNIPLMAEKTQTMMKDSLKAFLEKNKDLAFEVIRRDEEVDELQSTIYKNLLNDMLKDQKNIESASALLLVSSKLERIADQSTNICEEVIYLVTGVSVRHQEKLKRDSLF
ncbi:MAG: phosphate signaling complex protein PhoU [Deltaproteobacteria bacterium]|nr:phosphate signaling complex protein PhoU [Deltaproteobacteria bacterium]